MPSIILYLYNAPASISLYRSYLQNPVSCSFHLPLCVMHHVLWFRPFPGLHCWFFGGFLLLFFRGCFEDFVLVFFFQFIFFLGGGGVTIISFVKLKQVQHLVLCMIYYIAQYCILLRCDILQTMLQILNDRILNNSIDKRINCGNSSGKILMLQILSDACLHML